MNAGTDPCPTTSTLERLRGETLGEAERVAIESHIKKCSACQDRLDRLTTVDSPVFVGKTDSPPSSLELDPAFVDPPRQFPPQPEQTVSNHPDKTAIRHLGAYEITGRLGRGGMGTVYRARHRELDKVFALKVLPATRVDEMAVARFRNEMKAAGRLVHPNIVTATDAGRIDGTYYLAMDLVDGLDLGRVVERCGPLPVADACEVLRQAAAGLGYAHAQGLVHRDVKPPNLMLARGGAVKVLDLGLARLHTGEVVPEGLTTSGVVLGTADYIAPEQIGNAQTADARADVYGLGATLYFLLAGVPPFGGDGHRLWLDKLRAHQAEMIPPIRTRRPEVPPALASLLERMVAKTPTDRPTTADVILVLKPFAAGANLAKLLTRAEGVTPNPPPVSTATVTVASTLRPRIPAGRYALAVIAGAAAALLATVPFLGVWHRPPTTPASTTSSTRLTAPPPPDAVRLTFGALGPTRPNNHVLPGDEVCVEFNFSGIATNPDGRTDLSFGGELTDETGKSVQELIPISVKSVLALGGQTFTGVVNFTLPEDFPAGVYHVRVVLNDRLAGKVLNAAHQIRVLSPGFGAIRLRYSNDRSGTTSAGGHLTVGQQLFLAGKAVGFAREGGRIHVAGSFSVRDAAGNETIPTPVTFAVDQKAGEEVNRVTFDFSLFANRPGEYVVSVVLQDVIGGATAKYELPLTVHPAQAAVGQ